MNHNTITNKLLPMNLNRDDSILLRVGATLEQSGLVGEERAAKVLYLCLTSRLLDRPVSAKIVGPSSAGKSLTTRKVLDLFPESAYYELSAMSDKALAYSDVSLKNRFLVLYEHAGMKGDMASYLIRSLLSEGKISYETVESIDGKLTARHMEREGPTGLLTTTTSLGLHPENETRLFSIPINDSAEQTKRILRKIASGGDQNQSGDLESWRKFQENLASLSADVTIPFGERLADHIPPVALRLRRDFPALLSLIKSHTLLHREERELDKNGRLVATIGDYAVVRNLVSDLISDGLEATVAPSMRETVAAVSDLMPDAVSITAVAGKLGLDKSAASRRVWAAIKRGYLENLEDHKGKPAKVILGEPLPDDVEILPHPDKLTDDCFTVAA